MKKTAIGHVACPVCGFEHAEVKEDKNSHAFIFCPDCAAQVFTRNEFRDRALRKRMRPVTVTVTVTEPDNPPEEGAPVPADVPGPGAGSPTPTPVKKKKSTWFTPILAQGND